MTFPVKQRVSFSVSVGVNDSLKIPGGTGGLGKGLYCSFVDLPAYPYLKTPGGFWVGVCILEGNTNISEKLYVLETKHEYLYFTVKFTQVIFMKSISFRKKKKLN